MSYEYTGLDSEAKIVSELRTMVSDVNDMIRLVKSKGLYTLVQTDKTVVDQTGTRIDAIDVLVFKLL